MSAVTFSLEQLLLLGAFLACAFIFGGRFLRWYVLRTESPVVAEGTVFSVHLDKSRWYDASNITFEGGKTLRLLGDYRRVCRIGTSVRIERKLLGGHTVRSSRP